MYKLDLLKRMENMILKFSYVLLINISSGNILRLNRVLLFLQESFVEKVKVNLFSNLTLSLEFVIVLFCFSERPLGCILSTPRRLY